MSRLEELDCVERGPTADELETEVMLYGMARDEAQRNKAAACDAPRCSYCGRLLTHGVVCPDHDEVMV